MSHDKDAFELIVRQAQREFMWSAERRQPDAPFYHYTSKQGFEGILQTEAIWATDHKFLNDPEELSRARKQSRTNSKPFQGNTAMTPRGVGCAA